MFENCLSGIGQTAGFFKDSFMALCLWLQTVSGVKLVRCFLSKRAAQARPSDAPPIVLTPAGSAGLEAWLARHELESARLQKTEGQHTMVFSLAHKGFGFPTQTY